MSNPSYCGDGKAPGTSISSDCSKIKKVWSHVFICHVLTVANCFLIGLQQCHGLRRMVTADSLGTQVLKTLDQSVFLFHALEISLFVDIHYSSWSWRLHASFHLENRDWSPLRSMLFFYSRSESVSLWEISQYLHFQT